MKFFAFISLFLVTDSFDVYEKERKRIGKISEVKEIDQAKFGLGIMEAFFSDSSNMFAENGIDCGDQSKFANLGDLQLPSGNSAMNLIQKTVEKQLDQDHMVLSLGGDHSITFPIIQAYAQKYNNLNILHFDAHPDLYDNFDNNPYSHASPFARIMENNLVDRLVQVGIFPSSSRLLL